MATRFERRPEWASQVQAMKDAAQANPGCDSLNDLRIEANGLLPVGAEISLGCAWRIRNHIRDTAGANGEPLVFHPAIGWMDRQITEEHAEEFASTTVRELRKRAMHRAQEYEGLSVVHPNSDVLTMAHSVTNAVASLLSDLDTMAEQERLASELQHGAEQAAEKAAEARARLEAFLG